MKKRFGQHILVDKNYLQKIVKSVNLSKDDSVVEIGAGTGVLTCELAKYVKRIYAVELERDIIKQLKENIKLYEFKNIEVIELDFLKLDLNNLSEKKIKIIGNIPYNITSKILIKLFGEIDKPSPYLNKLEKVFLMIQLQVAKRLVALPGSKAYSPLTILIQYFTNPKILFNVPAGVFCPKPKVDSAFVEFEIIKNQDEVGDPSLLKNIIRTCFQQRRKKIVNSLSKFCENKNVIQQVIEKTKLDASLRADDLSFSQYVKLSNAFMQLQVCF